MTQFYRFRERITGAFLARLSGRHGSLPATFVICSGSYNRRSIKGEKKPVIRNIFNILVLALCIALSIKALAQNRHADRDYDDRSNSGMSAGGNWTVDHSEDRMTAEKRTRFQLQANDTRDGDDRAQVILYCTDGKLKLADFNPNLRLSRPNSAGFWGQP